MYYNSNKSSNDYYNAYKEEMENLEGYNNKFSLEKILKLAFIIVLMGSIALLSIYMFNYFSTEVKNTTTNTYEEQPLVTNKATLIEPQEPSLPKSIQIEALKQITIKEDNHPSTTSNVNQKDIDLIVKLIISQMDKDKKPKIQPTVSLEEQLNNVENKKKDKQLLKESNHYNKVIVSDNEPTPIQDEQKELREKLNFLLIDNKNNGSTYELAIKKEIAIRSNEMRIIIVRKGDTLSKIAKKAYGNQNDYSKIFIANPELLTNPNEIFIGQKLRIPV